MRLLVIFYLLDVILGDAGNSPLEPAIDRFTIDFIKSRMKSNRTGNIFFSPLSIEIAYSWLMGGSGGSTRADILKTLRLMYSDQRTYTPGKINKEFGELSGNYTKDTPDSSIVSGNLLAIKEDFIVKSEFMELAKIYHAEILPISFDKPTKVRDGINSFISKRTRGVIAEALHESPSPESVMMLVNAIHFKGKWNESFDPKKTKLDLFKNADETVSTVPMMNKRTRHDRVVLRYYMAEDHNILEMPYKDSIAMYIFLPHSYKKLATVIAQLDRETLEVNLKSVEPFEFDQISIPKFKFDQTYDLKKILPTMGMKKPFSNHANFTGISDAKKLKVGESTHKALIEVDEEGTRASASTEIGLSSFSGGFSYFIANHPFMFIIRDRSNSINLFAGIVNQLPNHPK